MANEKAKSSSKTAPKTKTTSAELSRIFDVARPGTLPPADATARPVIVSNRMVMQDPMMVPRSTPEMADKDKDAQDPPELSTRLIIEPLTDQADEPTESVGQEDSVVDEPAGESKQPPSEPPAAESSNALQLAESVPKSETNTESSAGASTDADNADGDVATPQTVLDKEAARLEADAKAQDELDTLVDQKTYFLPINSVEKRRSKHVFIFGVILIVILAAAWLDVAMDAGFISLPGVQPITHLFRN